MDHRVDPVDGSKDNKAVVANKQRSSFVGAGSRRRMVLLGASVV